MKRSIRLPLALLLILLGPVFASGQTWKSTEIIGTPNAGVRDLFALNLSGSTSEGVGFIDDRGLEVMDGDGNGGLGQAQLVSGSATSAVAGRFMGQASDDVVAVVAGDDGQTPTLDLFENDDKGGFDAPVALSTPPGTLAAGCKVTAGDLEKNERPDVLLVCPDNDGQVIVGLNDGEGKFEFETVPLIPGHVILSAQIGDFNGDGNADLLLRFRSNAGAGVSDAVLWGISPLHFGAITSPPASLNGESLEVTDYNGDSLSDLVGFTPSGLNTERGQDGKETFIADGTVQPSSGCSFRSVTSAPLQGFKYGVRAGDVVAAEECNDGEPGSGWQLHIFQNQQAVQIRLQPTLKFSEAQYLVELNISAVALHVETIPAGSLMVAIGDSKPQSVSLVDGKATVKVQLKKGLSYVALVYRGDGNLAAAGQIESFHIPDLSGHGLPPPAAAYGGVVSEAIYRRGRNRPRLVYGLYIPGSASLVDVDTTSTGSSCTAYNAYSSCEVANSGAYEFEGVTGTITSGGTGYSIDGTSGAIPVAYGSTVSLAGSVEVATTNSTTLPRYNADQTALTSAEVLIDGVATGTLSYTPSYQSVRCGTGSYCTEETEQISWSDSSLTNGSHTIEFAFVDQSYGTWTTSLPITLNVTGGMSSPTLSVSASPNPLTYHGSTTLTATLSGASSPTGTVSFTANGSSIGSASVSGSSASISWSPGAGSYSIAASYSGDSNNNAASGSTSLTVNKAGTSTSLTCSPSTFTYGSTTGSTCTATVSGSSPTGSVTFYFSGGGTWTTQTLSGGSASATGWNTGNSPMSTGVYAVYNGDSNNNGSTSNTATVTIAKANPSISYSCSPSTVTVGGASSNCTATVSGVSGGATPTGTVTMTYNGTSWVTLNLSNGSATQPFNNAVGSYTMSATYNGDGNYNGGANATSAVTVQKATPSFSIACSGPSTYGSVNVSCTPSVSGGDSPSGTISWGFSTSGSCTPGSWTTGQGLSQSVGNWAGYSAGNYTVCASYTGDSKNNSVSASTSFTINKATPSISAVCSPNPVTFGSTYSCSASVSGTVTGSVTFPSNYGGQTVGLTNGSASTSIMTATAPAGSYSGTVTYNGDSNNNAASTSASLTVTQAGTSTSLSCSPNPLTFGASSGGADCTATVSGVSPTGSVTFNLNNGGGTATVALSGNSASWTAVCANSGCNPGNYPVSAAYSGDTNNAGSSASTTLTIQPAVSSVVLDAGSLIQQWQAASLDHTSGYGSASGTDWVATPSDTTGCCGFQYGPYATNLLAGKVNIATWSMEVDNNTADNNEVAYVDVYDDATSTVVASETITRQQFAAANTFQTFSLPFSAPSPAYEYELRVAYAGNATLTEQYAQISGAAGSSTYGQAVTLSASVPVVNGLSPTGTVTFYNNGAVIGSAPVSASNSAIATATVTVANLPVGSNPITAKYSGDGNYSAATSTGVTQTVTQATPSVSIASSSPSSPYGQSVTFTCSASANSSPVVDGTPITFSVDGTTESSSTTTNGSATWSTAGLSVGTHTVSCATGGTNYTATSASLSQSVVQSTPSVSVSSSANPSTYGSTVTLTATVAGGGVTPTGTVTFDVNGTPFGLSASTVSINASGVATFVASAPNGTILPTGSDSITAVYSGDANYSGVTSPAFIQTVNPGSYPLVLSSSANPGQATVPITLEATLLPPSGPFASPTGTVTFEDGGTPIGTGTFSGGSFAAFLTTSSLPIGNHTITAVWAGDSNYTTATAAPLTETIEKATAISSLNVAPSAATAYGQQLTFTDVLSTFGTLPPGTVTFEDGGTPIGSGSIVALTSTNLLNDSNDLSGAGRNTTCGRVCAAWYVEGSASRGGPYPATDALSTSGPGGALVSTGGAAVAFPDTSSGGTLGTLYSGLSHIVSTTALAGKSGTFSVWLQSSAPGSIVLYLEDTATSTTVGTTTCNLTTTWTRCSVTGTFPASSNGAKVSIRSWGETAETINVWGPQLEQSSAPGVYVQTSSTSASGEGGVATFSISTLAPGTHTITAVYGGDANYAASTSPAANVNVNKALVAITAVSNHNPSVHRQNVTITITVAPPTGVATIPTGTVTLLNGGTTIGTGTLNSSGVTSISTEALPTGSDQITVRYDGDTNYY